MLANDGRGARWLEDILQDARYIFRGMARSKAFYALILFVLAIGVGVNTAIFSIVDAKLIKPLPFRNPSELVVVWDTYLPQFSKLGISPAELTAWQPQTSLFQATAWYRYVSQDVNLSIPASEPIVAQADIVSPNLFPTLGMSPLVGRMFTAAEDPSSALISEHLWRSRFASNTGVIGEMVRLNDRPATIVGVMPAAAQFPDWADLWLPKGPLLGDELINPVRHALGFIARLQPGVKEQQAESRLTMLSRRLANQHPTTSRGWGIRVSTLHHDLTQNVRPALLLLLFAACFLLLVGCANVGNLILSRASARAKEISVRIAVGANSFRILRQLITESMVIALVGSLAGLAIASVALKIASPEHPRMEPAVLLFLSITSITIGVLFGLPAAVRSVRGDIQPVIKSAGVTGSGGGLRSGLVVFEIALTMMLVMGAAILAKSFLRLMQTDPGFNPSGILTLRLVAPPSQQPGLFFHLMEQRLSSIAGVQQVAVTSTLPLIADRANGSRFNVPGSPLINPDTLPAAQIRTATPTYFDAMQIALKDGRTFTERDLKEPVVIVNRNMARRFWPGRSPVGLKFITGPWGPAPTWSTIIGVVDDVKQFGLDSEPTFDIYFPSLQGQYLIVKTIGNPMALSDVVQRTIHKIDPELALSDVRSMNEIARASALTRRWTMGLLVCFACFSFLLAVVGIFGVISWSVGQRTREIGIRMALGSTSNEVRMLFLRYGLKLTLAGLACGILASLAVRRALGTLVYGVSTADPAIYSSMPIIVLLISLIASYIPAQRAANADPLAAMRYE